MSAATQFSRAFVADLAALQFNDVFNPYSDTCPNWDRADAPAIRRRNLESVLSAAVDQGVDDIWVGLELGHGGGRRTGLPMTDDRRLASHAARFALTGLELPTIAGRPTEITAGAVWEALSAINRPVLLWNVFPLHSHKAGQPLSNRRHNAAERDAGMTFLARLTDQFASASLVAVGRDAESALRKAGIAHEAVRHPAFGGKPDFLAGVANLRR